MKISVLIATRNRPGLLRKCLTSLVSNDFDSYEILVIDQSNNQDTFNLVHNFNGQNSYLCYIKSNKVGKSHALNLGIRESKGEFLAFTDDDCVVSSNWLINIAREFARPEKEIVITGRILHLPGDTYYARSSPARKSSRKKTFSKANIFSDIRSEVLIGNNLVFHRSVFKKIGLFDESFGPGAIFKSCEDDDIGFRVLKANLPVIYSPDITVYHQSWRNKQDYVQNKYEYGFGKSAFYLKYFLKGNFQMLARFIIWFLVRSGLLILAMIGLRRNEILGEFSYLKGMILGSIQTLKFQRNKK